MTVTKTQKSAVPTRKARAGAAGTAGGAVLIELANELGVDLSWLIDRPILFGMVLSLFGLVSAWITKSALDE